jgi:hypothetical protein
MYPSRVARSKEPSETARQLIEELGRRGLAVSSRVIEDWAARGLAPAPVRRSLGRGRGTVSEYPAGAADQYAAVAAVMRRGLPWQVSVLQLFIQGHLPTDPELVRHAFLYLVADDGGADPDEDPLAYAERTTATRSAKRVLHWFRRNLQRSSQVLEPGTDIGPVITGVLATLNLARIGEPQWTPGALVELMAAYGVPLAEMADEERDAITRVADMIITEVMSGPILARIAAEAPLDRIQSVIPQAKEAARQFLPDIASAFPQPTEALTAVLTGYCALALLRIADIGGGEALAELASRAASAPTSPLQ